MTELRKGLFVLLVTVRAIKRIRETPSSRSMLLRCSSLRHQEVSSLADQTWLTGGLSSSPLPLTQKNHLTEELDQPEIPVQ